MRDWRAEDARTLRSALVTRLRGRRARLILAVFAGALALFALAGFLVLPALLRPVVERRLAAASGRPVTLHALKLNPFTLSLTLEGLEVREKGGAGPFLSLRRLHANLEASSLFAGGPVVRAVTLTAPAISLIRFEDGTSNVADLLRREKPAGVDEPLRFSVSNIRVEEGSIDLDDRVKGKKHVVRRLTIGIPFLSNIRSKVDVETLPVLEAEVNGASFVLQGKAKPFSESHETAVELDFAGLDLPAYLAYAPPSPYRLTDGVLDADLAITFSQLPGETPAVRISGTAALRDVALSAEDGPLVSWRRLDVALRSVEPLARRATVARVALSEPHLTIRRRNAPTRAPEPAAPEGKGERFVLSVAETVVEDGAVSFEDAAVAARPFRAELSRLAFRMRDFSNASSRPARLEASATSDAEERIEASGTLAAEPLLFDGKVALHAVPLKRYAPYLSKIVTFLVDDGVLSLATSLRYSKEGGTSLTALTADIASPRFRKPQERAPFFAAPSITLGPSSVDLAVRTLVLGTLASSRGSLAVRREKDGSADIAGLLVKSEAEPPSAPPWSLRLEKLALTGFTVKVDDRARDRETRFSLTGLDLSLEGWTAAPGARAGLATRFGVNGKGSASAQGPVGFDPVFADLAVEVKDIHLLPLESYVLAGLPLSLTGGRVAGAGTLGFGTGPDGDASVTFTGRARVSDLAAVERSGEQAFVAWRSLSADGLATGLNPARFEADRIRLSGLALDLSRSPEGRLNLARIFAGPERPPEEVARAAVAPPAEPVPPAKAAAKGALPLRVDTLAIEEGRVSLEDRTVSPAAALVLAGLSGRVTGLSSREGSVARADLSARLGGGASSVALAGGVNLFAAARFADLTLTVRGVDLSPFAPYAAKYVGYALERGALRADLAYRLNDRRLVAENRFVIDRLALGERVESPHATKLPVKLAISLLTDRHGVMEIDLPIEGSLDDPKFRIGRVILKVLVNLIGKAATAPFALLGKLLGGRGEEMSAIDFADGSARLDDEALRRVDALAAALADRPALRLRVAGRTSGEADVSALRRLGVERKIRARKAAALGKGASEEAVVVSAEERAEYLAKAYAKASFKKPRGPLGFAKRLPPEEMERLLFENEPVGPDDLRRLAFARAEAVREHLTAGGKVEPGRVLVEAPGTGPAEAKEGARGSRVDLTLE